MCIIISTLADTARVELLHPLLPELFRYVRMHDLLHTPCGRIELDGDRLFINNVNPQCVTAAEQVLEVHRRYLDVHILLEGEETIGWSPLAELKEEKQAYDAEADCALYTDRPFTYVTLRPGQWLMAWPEDAHAPVIGQGKIRKLIAKVRID